MVTLVDHFVASGDLILPNSSPIDHSQYFAEYYRDRGWTNDLFSNPFLLHNLAASFTRFVIHPGNSNSFLLPPHSSLRGDAVEHSEQLLDAVKKIKETHSLEAVRNAYYDWTEWVGMMEMVEQGVEVLTDLSFLQSPCFRTTLLTLQKRYQHGSNTPNFDESVGSLTSSQDVRDPTTHLPFVPEAPQNWMELDSTQLLSISTQTALPSDHSSSLSQTIVTDSSFNQAEHARQSQHFLTTLHLLLSRPNPTSFSWNVRPAHISDSVFEAFTTTDTSPADLNTKFDTSLFDETDDQKIVASLRLCQEVITMTKSTKCIVDIHSFRPLLLSGLHSANHAIQFQSFSLIDALTQFIPASDPRTSEFLSLRSAFRDGTYYEQLTLLLLWTRWFGHKADDGDGPTMRVTDFDFDGFLGDYLGDAQLLERATLFVWGVFSSATVSMSFQWKLDFILRFEKRNQMMSRLSSAPNLTSIILSSFMSLLHGYTFPSTMTDRIITDVHASPHRFQKGLGTSFFLSHTSIAPKHRRSFFPMDLAFERCLRDSPESFLDERPQMTVCRKRTFLNTPLVAFHSLLVRSIPLRFDPRKFSIFLDMFVNQVGHDTKRSEIYSLFGSFPPPHLLDTLLSSSHLARTSDGVWTGFFQFFDDFGGTTAPFGAVSSLTKLFKMLTPLDSSSSQYDLDLLGRVGELVVLHHWFTFPPGFDSPLICHLPSLARAQRGLVQTLSLHFGIPSLVTPLTHNLFHESVARLVNEDNAIHNQFRILSLSLRYLSSKGLPLSFFLSPRTSFFPTLQPIA
ncbi:hypothetical protein BLNAU_6024 [Blattamonas nauphoetae]|uniref:Uncharacterized protein n=1 Tax=Blattamonas nauphoetae TaxID=2049346 RepID=A0ABQ9Y5I6_9EUKA|nr:hypothetical protein BLNAU_6024 [Blattamonas nauphoetae]